MKTFLSIRNNYFDVIHYLVTSGKVKRDSVDKHGRTLVFTAVVQNKVEVLKFLLKKVNLYFVLKEIVTDINSPFILQSLR